MLNQNIAFHFSSHGAIFAELICNLTQNASLFVTPEKAQVLFKIPLQVYVENTYLTSSLLGRLLHNSDQTHAIISLLSCSCGQH